MAHHEHKEEFDESDFRVTSPMQPYSTRDAAVGMGIALVGLLFTFGVPLALV